MLEIAGMNQNNNPYVIVITGGIATGKSEASKYLRELGYTVLDCDLIVHNGYKKDSDLYKILVDAFSETILDDDKSVDRQKLGKIVLSDNEKLNKLNSLVHKYVVDELLSGIKNTRAEIIFLDIPLMFEQKEALDNMGLKYDEIWLIYVSEEIQKQRLVQRANKENKDLEQTLTIIKKQMPIEEKKTLAEKVINNEGSIENLRKDILKLIQNIR